MINYVRINVELEFMPSLSYSDDGNEVILIFENYIEGTKIELYHGGLFFDKILLEGERKEYKIPAEYCFDGNIMHIRGNGKELHIIGDEKAFSDLKFVKKTEHIMVCGGNLKCRSQVGDGDLRTKVVDKLPDKSEAETNIIYFVGKKPEDREDIYEEYILINGQWERFNQREEEENIDFTNIL